MNNNRIKQLSNNNIMGCEGRILIIISSICIGHFGLLLHAPTPPPHARTRTHARAHSPTRTHTHMHTCCHCYCGCCYSPPPLLALPFLSEDGCTPCYCHATAVTHKSHLLPALHPHQPFMEASTPTNPVSLTSLLPPPPPTLPPPPYPIALPPPPPPTFLPPPPTILPPLQLKASEHHAQV